MKVGRRCELPESLEDTENRPMFGTDAQISTISRTLSERTSELSDVPQLSVDGHLESRAREMQNP